MLFSRPFSVGLLPPWFSYWSYGPLLPSPYSGCFTLQFHCTHACMSGTLVTMWSPVLSPGVPVCPGILLPFLSFLVSARLVCWFLWLSSAPCALSIACPSLVGSRLPMDTLHHGASLLLRGPCVACVLPAFVPPGAFAGWSRPFTFSIDLVIYPVLSSWLYPSHPLTFGSSLLLCDICVWVMNPVRRSLGFRKVSLPHLTPCYILCVTFYPWMSSPGASAPWGEFHLVHALLRCFLTSCLSFRMDWMFTLSRCVLLFSLCWFVSGGAWFLRSPFGLLFRHGPSVSGVPFPSGVVSSALYTFGFFRTLVLWIVLHISLQVLSTSSGLATYSACLVAWQHIPFGVLLRLLS